MHIITAPDPFLGAYNECPKIFLGGSIENGKAENWQEAAARRFSNSGVLFLNPRREVWDEGLQEKEMRQQIRWELDALDYSNARVINFLPGTVSPISLLEMGIYLREPSRLFVVCTKDYFRYMNVKLTCERHFADVFDDLDSAINAAIKCAFKHHELHTLP